jgi:hypothetical protein
VSVVKVCSEDIETLKGRLHRCIEDVIVSVLRVVLRML